MTRTVEMSAEAVEYFATMPERLDAKRTKDGRTHPWRAHGSEPLSYSQKAREQQAVPSHANPIGRPRTTKRSRK